MMSNKSAHFPIILMLVFVSAGPASGTAFAAPANDPAWQAVRGTIQAKLTSARRAFKRGDLENAMRDFLGAESLVTPAFPIDNPVFGMLFMNRAEILLARGDTEDARILSERAIAQVTNPPLKDAPDKSGWAATLCRANAVLASVALTKHDYDDAVRFGEAASANLDGVEEECVGEGKVSAWVAMRALGRATAAEALLRSPQSGAISDAAPSENLLTNADRAIASGDYTTALDLLSSLLNAFDQPQFAASRDSLRDAILPTYIDLARKSGQAVSAEALANSIIERSGPLTHDLLSKLLLLRGAARFDQGQVTLAEHDLSRGLSGCSKCSQLETLMAQALLHRIYLIQGAFGDAERLRVIGAQTPK